MEINKPIRISLPKQISIEIEKAIKKGTFKIGEKIPSEPDLVKTFEVSRNTIREAIQSLIQAGVLTASFKPMKAKSSFIFFLPSFIFCSNFFGKKPSCGFSR